VKTGSFAVLLLLLLMSAAAGQSRKARPSSAAEYLARGDARWQKGDLGGAVADYTKAIELDPSSADAYYNRGAVRQNQNDEDGAIADYSKAIELNPQFADAYFYRGFLLGYKGDFDKALTDFDKAIDLKPTSADAYRYRCSARIALRDLRGAITDCGKALSLNPRYVDAYFTRGNAYNGLSEWGAGIADLTRTIELEPRFSDAYNHRAWPYLILNRNDLAYRDAAAYLRLEGATGENVSYVVLIAYFAKHQAGATDAGAILDEWAPRIKSSAWPYPVIRYLRQEISEQELLTSATNKEQTVESQAYIGMSLLLSGQRQAALPHLYWVRENGLQEVYEYGWVMNALRRLEAGLLK
jgi:tetratricopeptide (TPR) repeat protein